MDMTQLNPSQSDGTNYPTASAAVQQINPQQMSMQQKLAMMLMQGNQGGAGAQGQPVGASQQNPVGQTSPWSSMAQMAQMYMGGMGGAR